MLFKKIVDKMRSLSDRSRVVIYCLVILPTYFTALFVAIILDLLVFKGAGVPLAMIACLYAFAFVVAVETDFYGNVLYPKGRGIHDPLMLTVLFFGDMFLSLWTILCCPEKQRTSDKDT